MSNVARCASFCARVACIMCHRNFYVVSLCVHMYVRVCARVRVRMRNFACVHVRLYMHLLGGLYPWRNSRVVWMRICSHWNRCWMDYFILYWNTWLLDAMCCPLHVVKRVYGYVYARNLPDHDVWVLCFCTHGHMCATSPEVKHGNLVCLVLLMNMVFYHDFPLR